MYIYVCVQTEKTGAVHLNALTNKKTHTSREGDRLHPYQLPDFKILSARG